MVFGAGRRAEQVCSALLSDSFDTRQMFSLHATDAGAHGEVRNILTEAEWHETARLIRIQRDNTELGVGEIVSCKLRAPATATGCRRSGA